MFPPEAYGPAGALVVLGIVVAAMAKMISVLWADHLRADKEDRDTRDRAMSLAETVVPIVKQMAEAQAEANRNSANRRRIGDRDDL